MTAKTLQGEEIAKRILSDLKKQIAGKRLKLAVIQVGENAISETYIRKKEEAAREIGIDFELYKFVQEISQTDLKSRIEAIGKDKTVSGMIVQLPLPKHLNQQEILDGIPPGKDVDVLSSASFGFFALGRLPILPPMVGAVSLLLQESHIDLQGKNVVIVGAGRLVGLPLAIWCVQEKATVAVANEYTRDLSSITKEADILISGVGKSKLIQGNMVKKGALVIDAGTSVESGPSIPPQQARGRSGRQALLAGDIDFESVVKKASFVTPVPGGVGPLTVACLFRNVVALKK